MSLVLKSNPGVVVFSLPIPVNGEKYILINDIEMPMSSFVDMVVYVMCNSPLTKDDPRLKLIEEFRTIVQKTIDGQERLIGHGPMGEHYSCW